MSRDWMATLWPSSYKGMPFWIEHDGGATGRRLAVTDLPGAEDPDVEDIGRKTRTIDVTGYMLGDVSDVQMTSLETICETVGPGVLVMPAQGPITAWCDEIKRDRLRDKMGYFGFTAKFIRVGGSPAGALPGPYLAQLAFDGVTALAGAAAGFLNGGVTL